MARLFLLLLSFLLWECAAFAGSRPTHFDFFHSAAPRRSLSTSEASVIRSLRSWYRKQSSLTAPALDYGLREAAWRLADRLSHRSIRVLPHRWVVPALWLSGRSDHQITIFARAFHTPSELKKLLHRALASDLAGQRPNVFGVAVVSHRVKVC